MISSKHRFHGYSSLKQVYKFGSTIRGPQYAVKVYRNPKRKSYRVAVVVSRKVHKSAVSRNRIRRRLYEAIRLLENDFSGPFDIVINVFNDQLLSEESQKVTSQLEKQLKQAGILNR